ncbi:unnamed protein product [Bursaphelenchus okinawaensis]|uniref:Uncharacterized protein n=1 Tax=Bursaphelenchus okinawaensis TaxID=465554 RepID=A0A811KDS5_9BILA|nr:unnamed protein product [Bursaphelenchus okinawaensis]CAG9101840.1 unnamed protein product [Bursaphelenchus okinawaensis]
MFSNIQSAFFTQSEESKLLFLASQLIEGRRQATFAAQAPFEAKLHYLANQLARGVNANTTSAQATFSPVEANSTLVQANVIPAQHYSMPIQTYSKPAYKDANEAYLEKIASCMEVSASYFEKISSHPASLASYPRATDSPTDSGYDSQSSARSSPCITKATLGSYPTWSTTSDWYGQASTPRIDLEDSPVKPPRNVNAKPFVPRPVKKERQHPLMPHSNVDAVPFYPERYLLEEERWNL